MVSILRVWVEDSTLFFTTEAIFSANSWFWKRKFKWWCLWLSGDKNGISSLQNLFASVGAGAWLVYFSVFVGSCFLVFISLLFLLVKEGLLLLFILCAQDCTSASNSVHQAGSCAAPCSSHRIFSFLVFPALSQGSLQLSPDTLNVFFSFWAPWKKQNACLQLGLLSVKEWRWLCCSSDV